LISNALTLSKTRSIRVKDTSEVTIELS